MKLEHSINGLSKVSFSSVEVINPVTGLPTGVIKENWEDISHSAAKGLDELQQRIQKLEEIMQKGMDEGTLLRLFKFDAEQKAKPEKPPKEEVPPGKPLSRIAKPKREPKTGGKRGPKPKVEPVKEGE
jgi:hypothetical protein